MDVTKHFNDLRKHGARMIKASDDKQERSWKKMCEHVQRNGKVQFLFKNFLPLLLS